MCACEVGYSSTTHCALPQLTASQYSGFPSGHPSYAIIRRTASSSGSRRNRLRRAERMCRMQCPAGRGEVAMITVMRVFSASRGASNGAGQSGDTATVPPVSFPLYVTAAAPNCLDFFLTSAAVLAATAAALSFARSNEFAAASVAPAALFVATRSTSGHLATASGNSTDSATETNATVRGFGVPHSSGLRFRRLLMPTRLSQHLSPTSTAPAHVMPWCEHATQQSSGDAARVDAALRSILETSAPGITWKRAEHTEGVAGGGAIVAAVVAAAGCLVGVGRVVASCSVGMDGGVNFVAGSSSKAVTTTVRWWRGEVGVEAEGGED